MRAPLLLLTLGCIAAAEHGDGHGHAAPPPHADAHGHAPAQPAAVPASAPSGSSGHAAAQTAPGGPAAHAPATGHPAAAPPAPHAGAPAGGDWPPSAAGPHGELHRLAQRLGDLDRLLRLVRREHADAPDEDRLWAAARRGMLASLDPASTYLTRDDVALAAAGEEPLRHGFGFAWRRDGERIRIARIVPGSPAAKAGLRPGDGLAGAAGRTVASDGADAVMAAVRAAGDRVQLRLDGRDGEIALERADLDDTGLGEIDPPDERGLARIAVQRFFGAGGGETADRPARPSTTGHLAAAIGGMSGLRGLILDLRGNGGGNLQAALDAADLFIAEGELARIVSRQPARNRGIPARPDGTLPAFPLAVLVDEGTASSAEALAAALQDAGRAVVVGGRTRGKGSIQQLFMLPDGDAILLTVARLARPSGRPLDAGVVPDIAAAPDQAAARARDALIALLRR